MTERLNFLLLLADHHPAFLAGFAGDSAEMGFCDARWLSVPPEAAGEIILQLRG